MLFLNTECKIRIKTAEADGNEYGYIKFGNKDNLFFIPCSIKKFDSINLGFHTKLSIGKSKRDNPKIVYNTEDKDLYMLIKTEPNQKLCIEEDSISKIEMVKYTKYVDEDGETTVVLFKVLDDIRLALINGIDIKYINVKNKYVKYMDNTDRSLVVVPIV